MLRFVSVSTALSFSLLASSALFATPSSLHEEYKKELNASNSPIRVVSVNGQEKIALNHLKITGTDNVHQQSITGKGAKVIVIEAFFDPNHHSYAPNLTESTILQANTPRGFFSDYVASPLAKYLFGHHAAHVTGTITNMAPEAKVRVIDYGKEASYDTPDAVLFARKSISQALEIAAQSTGQIVNLSQRLEAKENHQTHGISSETRKAMIKVAQSGKIIVAAAGNEGVKLGDDVYTDSLAKLAADPEMMGRLVLVGATKYSHQKERLESWSDKAAEGRNHYIAAPGEDIYGPNSYGRTTILSGTSMAAPQVSGALALLMDQFPGLSPEKYIDLLFKSARKKSLNESTFFEDEVYGHGVLDVKAAIELGRQEKLTQKTLKKEIDETAAPHASKPSLFEKTKTAFTSFCSGAHGAFKSVSSSVKSRFSRVFG